MSGEKRVQGVTCPYTRLAYYFNAFCVSYMQFRGLFEIIHAQWLGIEPCGTMPIYVYTILGAANIPYLCMVIRCMRKDVPVPSYRLGVERRRRFFSAVMIIMFCISYNAQCISRLEASSTGLSLIEAVVSIVQLSCPAQDFTVFHIQFFIILFGAVFAILGGLGTVSWSYFIVSLLFFPLAIYIIAELDPEEQPDHDYLTKKND